MAICGSCKQEGMSVEHIRSCYASKRAALATITPEVTGFAKAYVETKQSTDYKPMALATDVPDSCYALRDDTGLIFYEVKHGKKGGKWETFTFVSRLIGHPGDWVRRPVKGQNKLAVLNLLAQDALASAKLFAQEFKVCAVCGSPLSDPISLEQGLGPICAKRF